MSSFLWSMAPSETKEAVVFFGIGIALVFTALAAVEYVFDITKRR